jgi:hypothetical protein
LELEGGVSERRFSQPHIRRYGISVWLAIRGRCGDRGEFIPHFDFGLLRRGGGAIDAVRSRWKVPLVLVVVFPAAEQTLDYFIHRARGTPNLGWAMLVSCTVMVVSAAFNWYVMTHGALLTNKNAAPLTTDLRRLPLLVLRFAAEGPLMMWRALFSGRAE